MLPNMGYSAYLRPRAETLTGEIEGIIDLANLKDSRRKRLEARPDLFFSLTYPTADVRQVVNLLDQRFGERSGAPGLLLFEGLKGSGKSHLLLLIYHLFKSQKEARRWLDRHALRCRLPEEITPVVNKFTDLPLSSIWDFIFEQVRGHRPPRSVVQPSLSEVESALDGRQIVLIFDELEQGVRVLADEAVRAQNIAFLQMLSEWANRSDQVTLLASIYSDQQEPGATLKRVPACRVQFAQADDRARVVLHRVFENYLDFRPASVASVIESYLNAWRRHSSLDAEAHRQRMLDGYPFTPDLLDIILRRIPARGGFQNVRGALGFLAHLVRITQERADLITPGHADISDREVAVRLADLDPGSDLITRAQGNLGELTSAPFAKEIASATLLYTLSGVDSRTHGATREELIRSALGPAADVNDFEHGLRTFEKYAAYFHNREGRYFFDREENADAKVELYSLKITDEQARTRLRDMWRGELFREPAAVIWLGTDETKAALEALDKDRLRWVLAPRRLSDDDRRALYHGLSMRNQVILLEPRDPAFDLESHADLLKWSKRILGAERLLDMRPDAARRAEYERIVREERGYALGQLRRAGLLYARLNAGASGLEIEEEPLGTSASREDVASFLSTQVYPPQLLAEHLEARLAQAKDQTVREIDREYRSTLGFPVPTHAGSLTRAVRSLCKDRKVGIYHSRNNFCGADPGLTDAELLDAVVGEPFEGAQPALPPRPISPAPPVTASPPPGTAGATAPSQGAQLSVRVGSQAGIGSLRQAVAARLQEHQSARVLRARFTVFLQQASGDLSAIPSAYRGSLAGPGSLTLEIGITKEEELSKAQVEQVIERLPNIPQAEYSADLTLLVPAGEERAKS
jgi:hypothetical protein